MVITRELLMEQSVHSVMQLIKLFVNSLILLLKLPVKYCYENYA